ncbi:MAG: glycosyltransferase family 39 protein [Burkholderiales bacterium]|nr:glycosyltransferase family 39 protein [Burkholderiales bacterium]MDE2454897.1 glycosyltransferase family 39 protein [Burkholderiales bacterium]
MEAERRPPWRELALLALWLFATLAWRPLLLPDEGRYAGVAYEMLHGDALVPTLDGLPFFHKPPLLYWLDMAAMRVFGAGDFAARFGPALLGWMLGAALFLHLRRCHGERVARIGLAVLATSPLFFLGAQYVNHDIGVAACIGAALLALARALEDPARTERRWLVAGWALCGLGVLAKGLIGIVLPALVIGPWLLAQGRWRQMLGLLHPLGIAAFALVALPWMVLMQSRYPGFYDYFIVEQHFRRFADADFNNHQPLWFFWVVLPLFMLPWTLWLVPALRERVGLYLWWIVAITGFFSLPSSKLVGYVLPAAAPLAALLALALARRGAPVKAVAAGSGLFCLALVLALAWKSPPWKPPPSDRDVGTALAAHWRPGDRLVFADDAFYDLRFTAHITAPVIVLSDWDDPDLPKHDNWKKELFDAGRFAPDGGRSVLWNWSRLPELACGGRTWIAARPAALARLAALPGLETVFEGRSARLLLEDGRCPKPAAK